MTALQRDVRRSQQLRFAKIVVTHCSELMRGESVDHSCWSDCWVFWCVHWCVLSTYTNSTEMKYLIFCKSRGAKAAPIPTDKRIQNYSGHCSRYFCSLRENLSAGSMVENLNHFISCRGPGLSHVRRFRSNPHQDATAGFLAIATCHHPCQTDLSNPKQT